jgi:hypothetical protein
MYLGPDLLMPIASGLAAVFGFALMFWKRIIGGIKTGFRTVRGKKTPEEG